VSRRNANTATFPALPDAPYNNLLSELYLAGLFSSIPLTISPYLLSEPNLLDFIKLELS
jgi:hypothetical protein